MPSVYGHPDDRKEGWAVGIFHELKLRAGQVTGPVIGISVVAYFAFHAVQGDRGLIALGKLHQDVEHLQAQVLDAREERMKLERKVYALRAESLDPDLLEERARVLLGYGRGDEVVVITHPAQVPHAVAEVDSN